MRLRVRVGLLLLLVLAAVYFIEPMPDWTMVGLVSTDLAYLLFSAIYAYLLGEGRADRYMRLVRRAQLPEKLILTTFAVYFAGGVLTPTYLVYSLAIIESILLMDPRGVYRSGALAAALYSGLALLESSHLIPHFESYFGTQELYEIALPSTYALHTVFVSTLLMVAAYMGSRVAQLLRYRNGLIERQLNDLRTLYGISNGIGNTMSESEVVGYLEKTLKETRGASTCVIGLLSREGGVDGGRWVVQSTEVARGLVAAPDEPLSAHGGLVEMLSSGEPLIVNDISFHPELQRWGLGEGSRAAYVYPVLRALSLGDSSRSADRQRIDERRHDKDGAERRLPAKGEVIGAIALGFPRHVPASTEYHDFLSTVASQAGVAIERARALADAQRMAREMSALYGVGLQMGSTLSKAEIVKRTSDHIERLLNPDMYYIALYEEVDNS
jgi:GAF domain-containing protein